MSLFAKSKITLPIKYSKASSDLRRKVRGMYTLQQKGLCACCSEPLKGHPSIWIAMQPINTKLFPEGFFNYQIHLHHDHKTDDTIGSVHARCNAYLWQFLGQ